VLWIVWAKEREREEEEEEEEALDSTSSRPSRRLLCCLLFRFLSLLSVFFFCFRSDPIPFGSFRLTFRNRYCFNFAVVSDFSFCFREFREVFDGWQSRNWICLFYWFWMLEDRALVEFGFGDGFWGFGFSFVVIVCFFGVR